MPRQIGYGDFTPARKAALKKAQLESARKRRKHGSITRSEKKSKKRLAAAGALAAIGVAGFAYGKAQERKADNEYNKMMEEVKAADERNRLKKQENEDSIKEFEALKKAAGNLSGRPESQEEWDARVKLYGINDLIGETSPDHNGRPEIHPGVPKSELMRIYGEETIHPTTELEDLGDEEYVVLYHRTAGGVGETENHEAKKSILETQSLTIKNRDEKRILVEKTGYTDDASVDQQYNHVWLSNKLNDSNTRDAFGETVVQIKFPKALLRDPYVGQQSFGELSPGEVWAAIPPDVIAQAVAQGYRFEDVPPEQITPKPAKKFRIPK